MRKSGLDDRLSHKKQGSNPQPVRALVSMLVVFSGPPARRKSVSNEDDEQLLIDSVEGMPARMGVFVAKLWQ
jgi:hypothetical protein